MLLGFTPLGVLSSAQPNLNEFDMFSFSESLLHSFLQPILSLKIVLEQMTIQLGGLGHCLLLFDLPGQQVAFHHYKVKVLLAQSCLTLCALMDCNPPGASVHGIHQARILEWVVIPFSRGSS